MNENLLINWTKQTEGNKINKMVASPISQFDKDFYFKGNSDNTRPKSPIKTIELNYYNGVLHSDNVRQKPKKAFGELSHQVVVHEPANLK